MGVWIETLDGLGNYSERMSHPAWVCGLKQLRYANYPKDYLSHPAWVCGLKHLLVMLLVRRLRVTPCVGVWIETLKFQCLELPVDCHTLRGCVD